MTGYIVKKSLETPEKANLVASLVVSVIVFFFLSNSVLSIVNDSLMRDGSMLTGTRYTITKEALITIGEDNSNSVIGTGSSQMFKGLDGGCVRDLLVNDALVYNIAQPSSRPYTDMLHIPRILEANPEVVLVEIAPNLLLNTSKSSEEYVELRFKLDSMNQDALDIGGWVDIIDPEHKEWVALDNYDRIKFKQEYFPDAIEERLNRIFYNETTARGVGLYGYIPDKSSEDWENYLQTPIFPADRYGFDGKSVEQRETYNETQMAKTASYKPSYYGSQSHLALDYQISTLLENEIKVIIVSPPYHPLSLSFVTEGKWDGFNETLQRYGKWPGVTLFDQTWTEGWEDQHFYDRNHLDDEGRIEFCNRIAPVIDRVLNQTEENINFDRTIMELVSNDEEEVIQEQPSEIPKLLVISVNVEAGSRCANLDNEEGVSEHVSRCIWGVFGDERAGITEMMDAADNAGVKISFFVDVLEIYSYSTEIIDVMQYIDSRGHDVQMRMYPAMVNSSSWGEILTSEQWIESGAVKDSYMSCWTQETADYWFTKSMEIFDLAGVDRPIAYRAGAYRYCDTIITSMAKHGLTQSYNYNLFTTTQNPSYGYVQNFEWDNGVMEFPVSYVVDENGEIIVYSRIDESVYEQEWQVSETFERFFSNQQETRVMTMVLYSFSFLSKNESNYFYLEDSSKLDLFTNFLNNLPDDYKIVSVTELQEYIDQGVIKSEFKLSLESISNECNR